MSPPAQEFDRNAAVTRARELRRSPTLPEGLLWQVLRRRPDGFKFRRQQPIGWYIVDFYCPAARLIVEVDGESHSMRGRPEHDARRDKWLRSKGLRVVRFSAGEVMKDLESVVTMIMLACRR
jgi:very-short-patch-repair endonuclease